MILTRKARGVSAGRFIVLSGLVAAAHAFAVRMAARTILARRNADFLQPAIITVPVVFTAGDAAIEPWVIHSRILLVPCDRISMPP